MFVILISRHCRVEEGSLTNSTTACITLVAINTLTRHRNCEVVIKELRSYIEIQSYTVILSSVQCTLLASITQRCTIRKLNLITLIITINAGVMVVSKRSAEDKALPICACITQHTSNRLTHSSILWVCSCNIITELVSSHNRKSCRVLRNTE